MAMKRPDLDIVFFLQSLSDADLAATYIEFCDYQEKFDFDDFSVDSAVFPHLLALISVYIKSDMIAVAHVREDLRNEIVNRYMTENAGRV